MQDRPGIIIHDTNLPQIPAEKCESAKYYFNMPLCSWSLKLSRYLSNDHLPEPITANTMSSKSAATDETISVLNGDCRKSTKNTAPKTTGICMIAEKRVSTPNAIRIPPTKCTNVT